MNMVDSVSCNLHICVCFVFNILFKTSRLIQVEVSFKLKGIALQTIHARELPDCYAFQNTVSEYGVLHFQHWIYKS